MDTFTYPEKSSDSAARVVFRSFKWNTGTPTESNANGIVKRGPQTSHIVLYLPGNFEEKISAEWGEEQVVTAFGAQSLDGALTASIGEATTTIANNLGLGGMVTSTKFAKGITQFPGEFLVFHKATPVQLSFSFDMIPKNKKEADTIMDIVKTLKTRILPTFTGAILRFPDIWSIGFSGIIGPGFPKNVGHQGTGFYQDMALVDVSVSYGGGEQSTLVFSDRNPVSIKLSLSFKCVVHGFIKE